MEWPISVFKSTFYKVLMLLDYSCFSDIFIPLRKKKIGYVQIPGNVGDHLITAATFQLFRHFGIDYYLERLTSMNCAADELVISGGGNMGSLYETAQVIRRKALQVGIPMTILPQSFYSNENIKYSRVFIRESLSKKIYPEGILAPDLALGYISDLETNVEFAIGYFLRCDEKEAMFNNFNYNLADPITLCANHIDYLKLAGMFDVIITDRLHFAISGLLMKRNVILLPNSYHKNLGMFRDWLKDLGCCWADNPEELPLPVLYPRFCEYFRNLVVPRYIMLRKAKNLIKRINRLIGQKTNSSFISGIL